MLCSIFSIANYILFLIKHISSWRKKSLHYEAYNLDMISEKLYLTLCYPMDSMEFSSPWNPPEYWSGHPFPSPGNLPNPGIEPRSHCRWILYRLSHKGSPRILERVAYPFSRGTSWPRNQTGVSYIAGGFFANWAMREAHKNRG